jgi:hypothetical protein
LIVAADRLELSGSTTTTLMMMMTMMMTMTTIERGGPVFLHDGAPGDEYHLASRNTPAAAFPS